MTGKKEDIPLPLAIETDEEYRRLLAEVEQLMDIEEEDLSPHEGERLEALVTLIERYEERRYGR